MRTEINYAGVEWVVFWYWEYPETLSEPTVEKVTLLGSYTDLYDYLNESTIKGLQKALEESVKN